MPKRSSRRPIPKKLQYKLLYDSQYVCAVCQRRGVQIHHIDRDNSNNAEANLVVLCHAHHDEAHTRRAMSKNLDAAALRDAKTRWTMHVRDLRASVATVTGQRTLTDSAFKFAGIAWGYINHSRVIGLVDPRAWADDAQTELYRSCLQRGLVDERGIVSSLPLPPSATTPLNSTVYDRFQYGDDQRVHAFYSALTDQIAQSPQVVHIERDAFAKSRLQVLLEPGSVLFMERAFYFKTVDATAHNEHRRVCYFKGGVEVEFFVDTRDMFGTTSITVSFSGHQTTAALIQLKSMRMAENGRWRLSCTPIAMGVGFQPMPDPGADGRRAQLSR